MTKSITKELIIAEAMNLIDEVGFEGLSMRKLALRLKIQAPTLYYHISDKSLLLNEILRVLFERCLARMPECPTWQVWMREFGSAIWQSQNEMRATFRLILDTQMDKDHYQVAVGTIRTALSKFDHDQDELLFRQAAVQAVVTGWSIFAHSAYFDEVGQQFNFREYAMRSVDSLVRGWEEAPSSKPRA